MSKFQRPESLQFPTIFRTFKSKTDDGTEFYIQDLPVDFFNEATELLIKHFLPEETITASKKLAENEETREISRAFQLEAFNQKLSIGCFMKGSQKLIAVNIMVVSSKGNDEIEVRVRRFRVKDFQ
jgi:hypothetical protein